MLGACAAAGRLRASIASVFQGDGEFEAFLAGQSYTFELGFVGLRVLEVVMLACIAKEGYWKQKMDVGASASIAGSDAPGGEWELDPFFAAILALTLRIAAFAYRRKRQTPSPLKIAAVLTIVEAFLYLPTTAPRVQRYRNFYRVYSALFICKVQHGIFALPLSFIIMAIGALGFDDETKEECYMGIIPLFMALFAKKLLENSQRKVFAVLLAQKKEIIHEKVLRVKTEFAMETLRGKGPRSIMEDPVYLGEDSSLPESSIAGPSRQPRPRQAPPSLHSAPSVMIRSFLESATPVAPAACPVGGDCLPPDAHVWVEGEPMPKKVSDVLVGQRLLCCDLLTGCLKHARISGVKMQSGAIGWVNVTLANGTSLRVTSDHPLQVSSDGGTETEEASGMPGSPCGLSRTVYAGELRPGKHQLMVLSMTPVAVSKVDTEPIVEEEPGGEEDEEGESMNEEGIAVAKQGFGAGERVSLSVQQPERHAIFVAAPGAWELSQAVAVGSADLIVGGDVKTEYRRSFLHFVAPEEDEERDGLRRSNSCPQLQLPEPASKDGKLNARPKVGSAPCPVAVRSWKYGNSIPSSYTSSGGDARSEISADIRLAGDLSLDVGSDGLPHGVKASEDIGKVRLRDLLKLRVANWRSLGCHGHADGSCRVCVFENQHQHLDGKPTCFKGELCEFCHDAHPLKVRRKARHTRGTKRKGTVREDQEESPKASEMV